MLLDGGLRKVMRKPVEIHTFDLVAHNLYTSRQASFDTLNTVSEVNTAKQTKHTLRLRQ